VFGTEAILLWAQYTITGDKSTHSISLKLRSLNFFKEPEETTDQIYIDRYKMKKQLFATLYHQPNI